MSNHSENSDLSPALSESPGAVSISDTVGGLRVGNVRMKDPAFLFYSQDFFTGVATMNFEDRGKYITILCLMHQQGRMTEETICFLVGSVSVNLKAKFKVDENGFWYNERLEFEAERRKKFTESRRLNGLKGGKPKGKNNRKALAKPKQNHMANHMGNENENENINYKKITEIYFNFYETKFGLKPAFSGSEGKHLKELITKLTNSIKSKGGEITEQSICDAFSTFLSMLPKFYADKIDLKILNSKYDGIIAEIRSKSTSNSQNTMQDIIAERERRRKEAAVVGKDV